jgi:hypothetical protein
MCVLTPITSKLCNGRDHPVIGSFTRVEYPPAYRNPTVKFKKQSKKKKKKKMSLLTSWTLTCRDCGDGFARQGAAHFLWLQRGVHRSPRQHHTVASHGRGMRRPCGNHQGLRSAHLALPLVEYHLPPLAARRVAGSGDIPCPCTKLL